MVTRHDASQHERRFKWCRCAKCNTVGQCTPNSDFYDADGYVGLFCHRCFPGIAVAVVARWKAEEN